MDFLKERLDNSEFIEILKIHNKNIINFLKKENIYFYIQVKTSDVILSEEIEEMKNPKKNSFLSFHISNVIFDSLKTSEDHIYFKFLFDEKPNKFINVKINLFNVKTIYFEDKTVLSSNNVINNEEYVNSSLNIFKNNNKNSGFFH